MASEYTPNYNLDLYVSTDKPNLRDQYNGAMGKIDRALLDANNKVVDYGNQVANLTTRVVKVEADSKGYADGIAANASQIATVKTTADNALSLAETNEQDISLAEQRITANEQKLATLPAQIANAQQTAEDASSAASAAQRSADTVAAKFPIRTSSIRSGAVTADKLDETSVHRLLTSFTMRRFDSNDPNADNVGLVCPDKMHIVGWYIEELMLLVINRIDIRTNIESVNEVTRIVLPSYVPRPTEYRKISECGFIEANNSGDDFIKWSGAAINTSGGIGPLSNLNTGGANIVSNIATFVVPLKGFVAEATSADAYKAANGMVR